MNITHKGKKYVLDVDRAIYTGVLIPEKVLLNLTDIPNGSVFKSTAAPGKVYLMVDNKIRSSGQCLELTHISEIIRPAWFDPKTTPEDHFWYVDNKSFLWVGPYKPE